MMFKNKKKNAILGLRRKLQLWEPLLWKQGWSSLVVSEAAVFRFKGSRHADTNLVGGRPRIDRGEMVGSDDIQNLLFSASVKN